MKHLLGRGALILSLAISASPADISEAATGGYPDTDAVDCSAQYGIYSWCKNGTWLSPRGYAYRNCTDWAAFQATRLSGVRVPGGLGNANTWDDNARGRFAVDQSPERGDAAQSNAGSFGHLGVVEDVTRSSGRVSSIVVSEYNKAGSGTYSLSRYYSDSRGVFWRDSAHTRRWDNFIDFNGSQSAPSPSPRRNARPGDFNGDGLTDMALFRPSDGSWRIRKVASFYYGQKGDIPVPADYNGDGKVDAALFRPSDRSWRIRKLGSFFYGRPGDIPVPADYNGDSKTDAALFRPSNSTWYIRKIGAFSYGRAGDVPIPGYYNRDRYADMAVYRPSNNSWYVRKRGQVVYGTKGDIPLQADYNNDGLTDFGLFRPKDGTWHIRGINAFKYGTSGDVPLTGYFNRDSRLDVGVYRPADSSWRIRNIGGALYGTKGDIPATQTLNLALLKRFGLVQ